MRERLSFTRVYFDNAKDRTTCVLTSWRRKLKVWLSWSFLQPSWPETLPPSDYHARSSARTSSWALIEIGLFRTFKVRLPRMAEISGEVDESISVH